MVITITRKYNNAMYLLSQVSGGTSHVSSQRAVATVASESAVPSVGHRAVN